MSERKVLRVLNGPLSVRQGPGRSAVKIIGADLIGGLEIEVDPTTRIEADGFVWYKHTKGWSAERSVDSKQIFLSEPLMVIVHETPDTTVSEPTKEKFILDVETLPDYATLVKRHPVDLAKTDWIQYFGNTVFARYNGAKWNYPAFAQGLHSGFDYGVFNAVGIPVYAGVEGKFLRRDKYGIRVTSGPYTLIYQHLVKFPNFQVGQVITPDTYMGEMDRLPGNAHLHFEIRYDREQYIINPLRMMPPMMADSIMAKFSNFTKYFYADTRWKRWLTPLEQPVILRGGPLIGPTA